MLKEDFIEDFLYFEKKLVFVEGVVIWLEFEFLWLELLYVWLLFMYKNCDDSGVGFKVFVGKGVGVVVCILVGFWL